eukprot:TRINITY_DN2575_c0_g1_i2.p1 TRINITY_DN2575_c0_g1~~TRINITY_DN2575_c0_g1_i2.p1  ORF type:complete len:347 (-),score=61.32 TRINITY_DN2575_c0_g1_i2:57-1097(-)
MTSQDDVPHPDFAAWQAQFTLDRLTDVEIMAEDEEFIASQRELLERHEQRKATKEQKKKDEIVAVVLNEKERLEKERRVSAAARRMFARRVAAVVRGKGMAVVNEYLMEEELFEAATGHDHPELTRLVTNRKSGLDFVCHKGLIHTLRYIEPLVSEVTEVRCHDLIANNTPGQLACLKYLHEAHPEHLTGEWLSSCRIPWCPKSNVIYLAVKSGNIEVLRYLHKTIGVPMADPVECLVLACHEGYLEIVEYLHTQCGLTADTIRSSDMRCRTSLDSGHTSDAEDWPLLVAALQGHLSIVQYLHTGYRMTLADAHTAMRGETTTAKGTRAYEMIVDVFGVQPSECPE